jgi:hypothetical protein
MTKGLKPAISFIIYILFLQVVDGQTQLTMTDYLSQKFVQYCKSVPREEIYLQMDREEYISGEYLWFDAYLIDRQSFKPSSNSKIVYFELLNPENRPVVQKRIGLVKGFGPGEINIPDTLTTGTYTIRAYTSWMKNFLPYNCFNKDIKIYNALSSKTFKKKSNSDDYQGSGAEHNLPYFAPGSGISVKTNNNGPDVLEVFTITDQKYRSGNNNLLYLIIQTHGKIDYVGTELLSGDTAKIKVPKTSLSPGINQITFFDLRGAPVCEKYIFTPVRKNPRVTLNSADSIGLRKKISIEIDMGRRVSSSSDPGHLSISVAPETNVPVVGDIDDYLILGTEYGIHKWSISKNKKINEIDPEKMDSLLLTLHSNWIDWGKIISGIKSDFKFKFENENHFLWGKLLGGDKNTPLANKYIFLSTPGKVAVFQYAKTDEDGNFSFNLHIDEAVNELVIQPEVAVKGQNINIESLFSDQYFKPGYADSTDIYVPSYISDWSASYQVRKIYGVTSSGDPLPPIALPLHPKRFYGRPDGEIVMADYIKLPVMQEVFFELVTGAFIKNKKSEYEITISDPVDNKIYDVPPLLMIDGVIIKDPSVIANLEPELVEKIDVEREKYMVGDYLFYGAVNIITKAGDFSNGTLPDNAVRLPYRVLDPVLSFVSPDYSSNEMKNSRIPDFRTTLYWNPSVEPGKDGKARVEFWSSDVPSEYEINIQGIDSDGSPVSLRKIIKVK